MYIYTYPSEDAEKRIKTITGRSHAVSEKEMADVARIIEDVRKNGDRALIEYTNRFDADTMCVEDIRVSEKEIAEAVQSVDSTFLQALDLSAAQIESFHQKQVTQSWINTDRSGTILGQLINPVDSAGLYVPGGRGGNTPLVSSVLMCGIPAKTAGVKHVSMVTPPTKDGLVNPHLLVAAQKVGIDAVYKVGSAWAIAALAFGTDTIPKADMIVGPGNIYVTLAKKLVAGAAGIDMAAGPSEILVLADHTATPAFAAADLLSQAEHDPFSSAVLITDNRDMADAVAEALEQQMETLTRQEIARQSVDQFGAVFVTKDMETAISLANRFAPEHLELHMEKPFEYIGRIRHAGAVFIGPYTPEPVGDYMAGPNHVLPTAGTARFSSALSVDHFIKKTSLIHYSKDAFLKEADAIIRLADIEGLDAHAKSVKIRLADL